MDEVARRYRRLVALLSQSGPVNEAYVAEEASSLADAGSGPAALLAANAMGAGFGCDRDWGAAFGWLAVAAERGEGAAQAQLLHLADNPEHPRDWRALSQAIDAAAWTAARVTRPVHAQPRIGVSDAFLDAATCAWLIARAKPLLKRARVYNPESGGAVDHAGRSNSEAAFTLLDLDLPILMVRERIAQTMDDEARNLELTSVFHYETGQTFAPHFDFIEPVSSQLRNEIAQRGQRVATFLIYLNDGFEGGETHFVSLGKRLRVGVGGALFFYNLDADGAPDKATEHEGAPPTQGEKWLLSQFIRDKPQCPG